MIQFQINAKFNIKHTENIIKMKSVTNSPHWDPSNVHNHYDWATNEEQGNLYSLILFWICVRDPNPHPDPRGQNLFIAKWSPKRELFQTVKLSEHWAGICVFRFAVRTKNGLSFFPKLHPTSFLFFILNQRCSGHKYGFFKSFRKL